MRDLLIFLSSIGFLAGTLYLGFFYTERFAQERKWVQAIRWFLPWLAKGALLPIVLWGLFNLGPSPRFPPLMPEIEYGRASGHGVLAFFRVMSAGITVVGSCWLAVTLGWLLIDFLRRAVDARDFFIVAGLLSALVLVPAAAAIIYFNGILAAGLAISLCFLPLSHLALSFVQLPPAHPAYSRAIARMKFGKYREAEWAVIQELERWQDDFDGWFMLAEIYATHFRDLEGAHQTVRELSAQPNITEMQMSLAANRLADWYLKLAKDPAGARRALEELCARFPDSHVAKMARQRIAQLPASAAELAARASKVIALPPVFADPVDVPEHSPPKLTETEAQAAVRQCVEKLRLDPNDVAEREKLATLLADALEQPDLAIEQLELLIQMPEQDTRKIPNWLSLMAAWRLRFEPDSEGGAKVLERLVEEYPQSPQAFAAQRRLNLMRMSARLSRHRLVS